MMGCELRIFVVALVLCTHFSEVKLLKCKCSEGRECGTNSTCTTNGKCYAIVYERKSEVFKGYGCFDADKLMPIGNPLICHTNARRLNIENRKCCDSIDYCNSNPSNQPTLSPLVVKSMDDDGSQVLIICLVVSLISIVFITSIAIIILKRCKKTNIVKKNYSDDHLIPSTPTETKIDFSLSQNSGSGSGLPLFIPMTIARQIALDTIVGTGRYGEVWRGMWRSEHVAVKIFPSREESSWFREGQIYQTVMLRHENILGFIAADNKDNGSWTQLWLVTDYHPHGSLFDYLNSTTISTQIMLQMLLSISNGLAHLHMEIIGTQGKPGIAHRDLKSKNILVKNNLHCCIADLGLAVKHDSMTNMVDIASNNRVGTVRYMAPEIIQDTIDPERFMSFKQADIYSLALVFWEIMRRCNEFGPPEEFQLPYYDCVPSDPTHEEMLKAVVTEMKRPLIAKTWLEHQTFKAICLLMKECWSDIPSARIEALRVKKSLMKIIGNHDTLSIHNSRPV